jgi:hypothetical protein
MLDAQLTHVRMPRHLNTGRMRHPEHRANLLQKADREVNALLFRSGQAFPPRAELIGELDLPSHISSMS